MVRRLRHRQTKGAATVETDLPPPRHISTQLKDENSWKKAGLGRYFPEREKQDVFPAASKDGFTAVRKIPTQSSLRA